MLVSFRMMSLMEMDNMFGKTGDIYKGSWKQGKKHGLGLIQSILLNKNLY